MSTITKLFKVDGVATNMTSVVLSSADGTYGVKRNDTDAVVVADGVAMTNTVTGTYTYTFTDPAYDLTYTYGLEFVYGGATYHVEGTLTGTTAAGEGMTLAQLIARLKDNSARTDQSNAQCVDWLNEAQRTLARRHNWRDLETETSSTLDTDEYRYAFPTNMKACRGIRIIDGQASTWLHERTKRWLNQYEPNPAAASGSKPLYYCVDGNYFEFPAPPDDDYTYYINYQKWATAFSTDDTTARCDIGGVDDALIAYGTAELFRKLGQDERANHWEAVFQRRYHDARVADNDHPNFMPITDGVIHASGATRHGSYWNDPEVG